MGAMLKTLSLRKMLSAMIQMAPLVKGRREEGLRRVGRRRGIGCVDAREVNGTGELGGDKRVWSLWHGLRKVETGVDSCPPLHSVVRYNSLLVPFFHIRYHANPFPSWLGIVPLARSSLGGPSVTYHAYAYVLTTKSTSAHAQELLTSPLGYVHSSYARPRNSSSSGNSM